jgi:glyoxylase-like metal-dependent hydrolase (beta-lactamase superfamily II)
MSGPQGAQQNPRPHPDQELQYLPVELPAPGGSTEVAPGIHWVRMPLPYALDHINLWLLEDGGEWVIVDSGLGNAATRALWDSVFAARLGGRRVSRLILTHYHPDHAGNAGWLTERFGVPMLMSQAEFLTAHAQRDAAAGTGRDNVVAMYRRNGLAPELCEKLLGGGNNYLRGVPEFPVTYERLLEGDEVTIGGTAWRVIMGYGHAPEHAALYCEARGVLISGDMVLPRISTNVSVQSSQPEGNPLKLFLDSTARYAKLPADTLVLPSHGKPFRGLRRRAEQLAEHHRLRLAELREACDTPKTAADVLTTLFRRPLDTHQTFFAMGEAMAHLHYLYAEKRLQRVEADNIVRYVRG